MDFASLSTLGFALFLARDAALLAHGRGHRWHALLLLYSLFVTTVCCLLGMAAEWISREEAVRLLRDIRLWLPAIALHVILWMACWLLTRWRLADRWSWLLALLPAPVFVYSAGGLCWLLLQSADGWRGWQIGAALGLAASGVVFLTAWLLRAAGANVARSLEFAAASNLAAILLLPLYEGPEMPAAAWQHADGQATFWALAATTALISVSFVFHRLRQRS